MLSKLEAYNIGAGAETVVEAMEQLSTKTLKGYDLKERIGAGGFGAVFRAYQTAVGREVAVKVILPNLSSQADFIRRFEGEAQVVARLEHPHITPLYDYWRDEDGAYLVMRLLRGGSLKDALKKSAFDLQSAARLLDEIAGALSLAHRNGIIHRDIKPANILLDEDGNAYLTDFGIAKDLNLPSNYTQADAIIGSLDYISPEQARSEAVTARTDIYSLGVTLYEMITGNHPFAGLSAIEQLYKHINEALPEVTEFDPNVNEAINQVIQKATQKNPELRYGDALAFAADFREAVGLKRHSTTIEELLTQREHDILSLIIEGLSNKEIAARLTISLSTVKWYVNQIYEKMGVRSRVQAIVRARELNLIAKGLQASPALPIATEDFHPENPYKGLRAFQSGDYLDFFGREKLTAKLLKRFAEASDYQRFLAIVGPSGSGKSSLVKAGLIPALWRGEVKGSEKWFIVEMLPGPRPLDELEIALSKIAAQQAGQIREHLQRDKFGLLRVANLILPDDGSEILLVIDQFEEVFTLLSDESTRLKFLDLLTAAVTEIRSRLRIIITLRADFYDRPLHYPQFGELLRQRLETIMPLSAEELEHAIVQPAQRLGVTFEAGLVLNIIEDVNYQPGTLPLLQYALTELFEQREGHVLSQVAYERIGKATGALAKRAEEIYLALNDTEKELARQIFLRLVTLGTGTEDSRRRVLRTELLGISKDTEAIEELLDTFAAYRLLSLDKDTISRNPTVDIAHEALIREWERLRLWLNESRADIQIQRQLAQLATEWLDAKKDKSFLARGSRLENFEKWKQETDFALTSQEKAYLVASSQVQSEEEATELEHAEREKRLEQRSSLILRVLVAVFALASLLSGGLAIFAFEREFQAQREASVNRSLVLANDAQDALVAGQTELALHLALQAVNIANPPVEAEETLRTVALATGTRSVFRGHNYAVKSLAFSPDDRFIASGACGAVVNSLCTEGELILWNVQNPQQFQRFTGHTDIITSIVFTADGQHIWSASVDGTVISWSFNPNSTPLVTMLSQYYLNAGSIQEIALSGNILVAATERGIIGLDIAAGSNSILFAEHEGAVTALTISADGQYVLSGSEDGSMLLWNLMTGEIIQRFEGHTEKINQVAFHPTLPYIFSASVDSSFREWDLVTGAEAEIHNSVTYINGFSVTSDGQKVILDAGSGLHILDTDNLINTETYLMNNLDGELDLLAQGNNVIVAAHQGFYFATGLENSSIVLWNLGRRNDIHHFRLDSALAGFVSLGVSPAGTRMISGTIDVGEGSEAILWNIDLNSPDYGQVLARLGNYQGFVIPVTFSPDGRYALVASGDYFGGTGAKSVTLWNVDENSAQFGEQVYALTGFDLLPRSLAFTPDGSRILVGTSILEGISGELLMWDTTTGTLMHRFDVNDSVSSILITPDGKHALTSHNSTNLLAEWDIDPASANFGALLRQTQSVGYAFDMAWGPDGTSFLITEVLVGLVERDYTTWEVIRYFNGLGSTIWSVDVSDTHIIAGNEERRVALWDYNKASLLWLSPIQDGGNVAYASFSSDGQFAYTIALGGSPVQWQIAEPSLAELLDWIPENRYVRDFTCAERLTYRIEPFCSEASEGN